MASIRAAILDMDGTLIDSNDAHARAWQDAFREFGYDISYEDIRRCVGMGGDKLMPEVSGIEEDTDTGKQISKRRGEIFKAKYVATLKPFDCTRELVQRMRDHDLKVVIASSAKADELDTLLKIAQVDDLIEHQTSSDDADNSKPDPDIIAAALEKSGVPAASAIMLGDTPYDVESAKKAGVGTIALRCGGWFDDGLEGALAIYDDPADLLAHFDESPLAR
jgi:HAD superfamily hydrolase (TIGR01509 family)